MDKTTLILGGNGLVAGEVAKKLAAKKYKIVIIDPRAKPESPTEFKIIQGDAFKERTLFGAIKQYQPDVIVNGINIATIFSQDTDHGLENMLNFYIDLYQSLAKINKRADYIQIGTTGSGGLGFNIPFTHGEKIEELPIIRKAAFAGITTAMLTLLSKSFSNGTIIAEIKPALAIFHREPVVRTNAAFLDGGESGLYSYNEVALLTSFMGFTTADRVAEKILYALKNKKVPGLVTKYDVIDHVNHATIDQEARDVIVKKKVLRVLKKLSEHPSILVTGNLGPPSVTRDFLIAHLIVKLKQKQSESQFADSLNADILLQKTLSYIGQHNRPLQDYLKEQLNYSNYLELFKYFNQHRSPWELLRDKFQALKRA